MVDDNPNDITTSKGQYLWRQRILKERAHFSPNKRENFSVRSALRVLDVPSRFKPHHLDPHDQRAVEGLDSVTERYLRADVASKLRVPNEQLLWPETETHQVGWHAQAGGAGLPYEERGTMFGLAPRLGIGWSERSAGEHARASAERKPGYDVVSAKKDDLIGKWMGTRRDVLEEKPQRPRRKEVHQRWLDLQESWEQQKRLRKERRRRPRGAEPEPPAPAAAAEVAALAALEAPRRRQVDFSLDHGNVFAPAACCGLRSALHLEMEDAWQGVGVVPRPDSRQEQQVKAAAKRNRDFLNRPGNPWFKPKGSSDVVAFGNAYAKSWGKSVFSRSAMPNAATAATAAPAPEELG